MDEKTENRIKWGVIVAIAAVGVWMLFFAGCVPVEEIDLTGIHDSVDKLSGEVDRVQEHVAIVNDASRSAEGLLEKVTAGVEASKPFNPWADEMSAALGVAAVIGGWFWKKDKDKYKAHKAGVNKTLAAANTNGGTVKADVLYNNIGAERALRGVS